MNPQGSLLEQKAKRKNNLPVIVAIFLGIHAVVLGGILMAGCKPESKVEAKKPAPEPALPPITPPADLGSPVAPLPGTPPGGAAAPGALPPIGSSPAPGVGSSAAGAPGLAPLPATPTPPPVAPIVPPVVTPPPAVMPEPAPAAPAAPVAEAKVHVVAKNDSFYSLSKKYGVSMKAIEAANPGVDSTKLKLGQKVNIPAAAPKATKSAGAASGAGSSSDADGLYTVKSGDVLGSIAKKFGTTVGKLREANQLKTDQIKVGQKLKVPAGSPKASSAPLSNAAPAPKADAVPALPPTLPPLGEPAPSPAPKF